MSEKLKKEFIELLEKDRDFRYTVAGYLGLSEILKRLDRLEEGQNRLWEEVRGLREDQKKLWENQNRLWEGQAKLWEEVRGLREGQNKLWEEVRSLREEQNRLWEEVKSLREGQNRLWEGQAKLWDEVKSLREGQNRLWEEVKLLRVNYDRMRKYMVSGFRDLKSSLGVAFEDHAASFLELTLEEMGYPEAKVEKKIFVHDGEIVEVNLFCEKPLVVGEATVSVKDAREAEAEVEKLLKRVKVVEEKYGKPEMIILSVARPTDEAAKILKDLAERHGIRLVLGKEIEEELTI
jgi:regulator of replication initiation timing